MMTALRKLFLQILTILLLMSIKVYTVVFNENVDDELCAIINRSGIFLFAKKE